MNDLQINTPPATPCTEQLDDTSGKRHKEIVFIIYKTKRKLVLVSVQ